MEQNWILDLLKEEITFWKGLSKDMGRDFFTGEDIVSSTATVSLIFTFILTILIVEQQ